MDRPTLQRDLPGLTYPPDWAEIRLRILTRAGNACEACGIADMVYVARVDGQMRAVPVDRVARARELGFTVWIVSVMVVARDERSHTVAAPWWREENLVAACTECVKTGAARTAVVRMPEAVEQQAELG